LLSLKTEKDIWAETLGESGLIELRQRRRIELETKREDRMIKYMVKSLDLGTQLDKIMPEQMVRVDVSCCADPDARQGFLIYEGDLVIDSRMIL
jgi:hypothetical protein